MPPLRKAFGPSIVAVILLSTLFAARVRAGVPNRIVYQGRLSKSGVAVAGAHVFVARILNAGGDPVWSSGNLSVTLPATGEFSVVLEPSGVDWLNDTPKLEISVDGETLSPADTFAASPYALVAQQVADGALSGVTVAAGKVALSGSSPEASLASWQSASTPHLIDGSKVAGTVLPGNHAVNHRLGQGDPLSGLEASQFSGTALVATTGVTQTVQPTANVTALTVKGNPGGAGTLTVFEVWDNQGSPAKQFHIRGDGQAYFGGNVGVGTTSGGEKLEVNGRIKDATGFVTPVGAIVAYGGSSAPSGWLLCDGTAVSRTTYAALFGVLGTTYGSGDGGSTFNLPDLRGRFPLGAGSGPGLTARALGGTLGEESHVLSAGEMPSHSHGVTDPGHDHNTDTTNTNAGAGGGFVLRSTGSGGASTSANTTGISVQSAGSGAAHNTMPPAAAVSFIIKT